MLFRILKKDMLKRKGVNFILFLFIILATVFLASSVNNILVVTKALDYYMEVANVPEVSVLVSNRQNKTEIDAWLEKQKEEHAINEYAYDQIISTTSKSIQFERDNSVKEFNAGGASVYLAKMEVPYNKVFDQQGRSFELGIGEIAISTAFAKSNDLEIGDKIKIKIAEQEKEFKISKIIKDAAFGNEMIGMSRFMISSEDYNSLEAISSTIGLYYVETENVTEFSQKLNNEGFSSVMNIITADTYKMAYSFDMLIAALLILIGICLIVIAMLVLRFTLIFTMEEQYQEIGILKAIGFRNSAIKKIYLIKYLTIVLLGAFIGLLLSFPISNAMIASVSENILMESGSANYAVNIICAIIIIVIVLLFCYFCTRKLNNISAMTTIRGGETGERFGSRKGIRLTKRTHMPIATYLGLNDILSHLKRFSVLIITFGISFILITIPLNTVNTMKSDEMNKKFVTDPDSPVYVKSIEQENEEKYSNIIAFEKGIESLKETMLAKGYETKLTGTAIYFVRYGDKNSKERQNIMTLQLLGDKLHFLEYTKGKEPLLENEVAFSETLMQENGWVIGDYVNAEVNGKERNLLITGTYSDYMQLGKSARLNPSLRCDKQIMFDYWHVMVSMNSSLTPEELAKLFKEEFPTYDWMTAQELVDQNVGGIQETLADIILPMTLMLTLVIMLITLLMGKLFIAREKGELAMLKSIGFSHKSIRSFHITRMILIALCSMALAVPLSLLSNAFMLKPIFGIMGASVTIQVQPLEAYLIYPGILLIGIILATIFATRDINKIHIREMNTLE